ncbi:carboxypeptidase-like regulatory domain-containing protein [Clostridium sp. SHJSY1]|uniref:MSCRAMM family protein n=1 Tax=Clostridium sp. SHJSY1 TaxID=2942483 RepID=UPI0028747FDD|nr:carboxypeptidase-like regulatory domain-containing protein [Clostridium sp. SHJSY1]MDS0527996.1 carboxypeptidase-like regulatory domain-containing protein [Clostridium sp. SHJSY1]
MPFTNLYDIEYSNDFSITGRKEITEDLKLTNNPIVSSGTLTGTVISEDTPVIGATVKLYDSNYKPIEHVTTIESDDTDIPSGSYTFTNIPAGAYNVVAIKDGYLLSNSYPVIIQNETVTKQSITLTPDPAANLNTIYGIISSTDTKPIENAIVTLSTTGSTPKLIGKCTTNDHGQYFFTNIPAGLYTVTASKPGYISNPSGIIPLDTKEIFNLNLILQTNSDTNTGTVSGLITNTNNIPLPNATVALYSIVDGFEGIIAITKTSASGRYLFTNITPGEYRVKATVQTEG